MSRSMIEQMLINTFNNYVMEAIKQIHGNN